MGASGLTGADRVPGLDGLRERCGIREQPGDEEKAQRHFRNDSHYCFLYRDFRKVKKTDFQGRVLPNPPDVHV
jgi:hypothetical protein